MGPPFSGSYQPGSTSRLGKVSRNCIIIFIVVFFFRLYFTAQTVAG